MNTSKQVAQPVPEEDDSDVQSIAAAATAIFNRNETEFSTADGVVVKVQQAKTRHLTYAMTFLETLMGAMSESQLHGLVATFAAAQKKAIAAGIDPNTLDAAELTRAALGNASIILTVASKVASELPQLVTVFTNLSVNQVNELDVEELVVVICKIFLVNYSFFTQTLRPILLSFAAALLSKMETAKVSKQA